MLLAGFWTAPCSLGTMCDYCPFPTVVKRSIVEIVIIATAKGGGKQAEIFEVCNSNLSTVLSGGSCENREKGAARAQKVVFSSGFYAASATWWLL